VIDPRSVPVTVVIAARNEAADIGPCVQSVAWAAEVIVVENDSTDDTVARARAAGAVVFSHPFSTIGAQRNAAIARATQPWILVIDADERATPDVSHAVREVVTAPGDTTAWRLPRRNHFLGREIRHGGWERDRPVRLFRRDLRYDERPVHEHVIVHGRVGVLTAAVDHTPYATLAEYFEKLHRYSRWWADQQLERGRRASLIDLTLRPVARFVTMSLVRQGWRDGAHGVVVAVLGAMSVAAKYAQLWALQRRPPQ
jgi:glycosyltransferase involved in cell wall biosynthesis